MKKLLPHLTLSMLTVFTVLIILDGYNPAAGYLNSDVSKVFDLILIGLSGATAVRAVCSDRRQEAAAEDKENADKREAETAPKENP